MPSAKPGNGWFSTERVARFNAVVAAPLVVPRAEDASRKSQLREQVHGDLHCARRPGSRKYVAINRPARATIAKAGLAGKLAERFGLPDFRFRAAHETRRCKGRYLLRLASLAQSQMKRKHTKQRSPCGWRGSCRFGPGNLFMPKLSRASVQAD